MQVALAINHREVVADDNRATRRATGELVLLPYRGAGGLVERLNRILVIGDVEVAIVDRQSAETAEIARPDERAAQRVKTGEPPLVGGGTHLALVDDGQARDIGDALELGCAFRRRDVPFPGQVAGTRVDGQ